MPHERRCALQLRRWKDHALTCIAKQGFDEMSESDTEGLLHGLLQDSDDDVRPPIPANLKEQSDTVIEQQRSSKNSTSVATIGDQGSW